MAIIGGLVKTELEFLVACVEHMRSLPPFESVKFRKEMEEYFRLNSETCSTFVYDDLIRLAAIQAGTLKGRDGKFLEHLKDLTNGEFFRIDGRLAIFREHFMSNSLDGWFTYVYADEYMERNFDYNTAWSLITEGRITFGEKG